MHILGDDVRAIVQQVSQLLYSFIERRYLAVFRHDQQAGRAIDDSGNMAEKLSVRPAHIFDNFKLVRGVLIGLAILDFQNQVG